jgi:hypothetical protein
MEPMTEIEDRKTWLDMGRQAHYVFQGALDAGASTKEALMLVREFYAGIMLASINSERENQNDD